MLEETTKEHREAIERLETAEKALEEATSRGATSAQLETLRWDVFHKELQAGSAWRKLDRVLTTIERVSDICH